MRRRSIGRSGAVVALLGVLSVLAAVAPPPVAVDSAQAASAARLRVASFNVQSVSLDAYDGNQKPWRVRRGAVISNIIGERPDVIGVQETNPSSHFRSRLVDGDNQFMDLRNGLAKAGVDYRLTNRYGFNCVDHRTSYKCVKKARGASHAQRILYNSQTVELVSQGAVKYATQAPGDPRHVAWAVLKLKANGSKFFFANTHLAKAPDRVLVAQWKGLAAWVADRANGLPVVVVGDFNVQKFNPLAADMLPGMRRAGFGDTLNQRYAENPVASPRALDTVNGWINSANHESKDVASYGYEDARHKTGNSIDYIFASNDLVVKQWKLVLRFDPQTLLVQGTLPSDHNMIRADLLLP